MRQGRIAIGQLILEPAPFIQSVILIERYQASRQFVTYLTSAPVTDETLEIIVDADQSESPGSWTGCLKNSEKGLLEYTPSHVLKCWCG